MPRSAPTLTGLALSGGGFRATLFHLGSLKRLNELGLLRRLDLITAVSGGSILAAWLALAWKDLTWETTPQGERASNFDTHVEAPLRAFCAQTLDLPTVFSGLLPFSGSAADRLMEAYDTHLFRGATLADLPRGLKGKAPNVLLYATSLQSGASVRLERDGLRDYRVGHLRQNLPLAQAVAASSAFPPLLSPMIVDVPDPAAWKPFKGADLHDHPGYRDRVMLTDGGVYDNLGLEALAKRCGILLVSDAGAPLQPDPDPSRLAVGQIARVQDILIDQTRALRKRDLIADFRTRRRLGAYWGITTRIASYRVPAPMAEDTPATEALSHLRTRLDAFSPDEQQALIDWGHALADAALRRVSGSIRRGLAPKPSA